MNSEQQQRHAKALDMHLAGYGFRQIGRELGVSRERARQIVDRAKEILAFRVFRGCPRALPKPRIERNKRDWLII